MIYIEVNGILIQAESITPVHLEVRKYYTTRKKKSKIKDDIKTSIIREVLNSLQK